MPKPKFEKGNPYRFTKDNQPSAASKSRGWKEKATAKAVALELLKEQKITDPKMVLNLQKIFPRVKTFYGYHVVIGRLYLSAADGSVKALDKLMRLSGDLTNGPMLEAGEGSTINITAADSEGAEIIRGMLDGDSDD